MERVIVLGATDNPARFSYKAMHALADHGHDPIPVGIKNATVLGKQIITDRENFLENIDTITLYVGPVNQPMWYDYILATKPKRIIMNPGTENPELMQLAKENDIEVVVDCTLVLLAQGRY